MAELALTEMPEYKRLTSQEKHAVMVRMIKVYAAHRHPERPRMMRRVIEEIRDELRNPRRR